MRVFVVDAFTDRPFGGNPAGVVLLDGPADEGWMQQVAAELRHSETAFVGTPADGQFPLRWFTPTVEVDLCGHATIASAAVLAREGISGRYRFATRSGVLTASVDGPAVQLDFPATPVMPRVAPAGLAEALGVEPLSVHGNDRDLLVELGDADTVARLAPDIAALRGVECRGVIATAAAPDGAEHDFVSRFFAPRVGVDEDPVTGSAHCALAPFWGERLGRDQLIGRQLSARGGRVTMRLAGGRVLLSGNAAIVLAGELLA